MSDVWKLSTQMLKSYESRHQKLLTCWSTYLLHSESQYKFYNSQKALSKKWKNRDWTRTMFPRSHDTRDIKKALVYVLMVQGFVWCLGNTWMGLLSVDITKKRVSWHDRFIVCDGLVFCCLESWKTKMCWQECSHNFSERRIWSNEVD